MAAQWHIYWGATSASYTLNPTSAQDQGATFAVVVSNPAGTVTSAAATLTVSTGAPALIDQSGWTLEYVDSEEVIPDPNNYPATQAFDGLDTTIWHTEFRNTAPGHPHDLIVDLGAVYAMEGFRALPEQGGGANGRIGRYEFYVKDDSGTSPTTPPVLGEWTLVASGTFPNTAVEQEVLFATTSSRYVWLRALDEAQGKGNPWTALAELNVLGTLDTGGTRPPQPLPHSQPTSP